MNEQMNKQTNEWKRKTNKNEFSLFAGPPH